MILSGLWLMLPALLPNSAAVLFGGGRPVDMGRSLGGRRILGDGKTWMGLAGGWAAGVSLGIVQLMIALPFDPAGFWGFGPFPGNLLLVATLSLGSLMGDMGGSFLKRRLDLPRGARFPVLDQYDFLIGAFALALLHGDWFYRSFLEGDSLLALAVLLVAVPLLHRAVNIVGYKMGKKDVPW